MTIKIHPAHFIVYKISFWLMEILNLNFSWSVLFYLFRQTSIETFRTRTQNCNAVPPQFLARADSARLCRRFQHPAGVERSWNTTAGPCTTGDSDPANWPAATSAIPRDDSSSPRPPPPSPVSSAVHPSEIAANCSRWPWTRSDRPPCTRPFAICRSHRYRSILRADRDRDKVNAPR